MVKNKARKRNRTSAFRELRNSVIAREPWCRVCMSEGRTTIAVEVDHFIPLKDGGTDRVTNLQPICSECHQDKTRRENKERWPTKGTTIDGTPLHRLV